MTKPTFLADAIRLPVLDWQLSFFGAHMQTVPKGWQVPKEKHLAFEIIYILDGQEELIIDNDFFLATTGDIVLIPPGFQHEVLPVKKNKMTYFCAHFELDDPTFISNMVRYCDILIEKDTAFNQRLRLIIAKWLVIIKSKQESNFNTKMSIQIILSELLIQLNTYSMLENNSQSSTSINSAKYAKEIAETIKYSFKKNILGSTTGPDLKIEKIIESVGLSSGYGYQVFKQVYGFSPREYLSKLKLNEAKAMLMKPDLSIEEIGKKLGYNNTSHFSRQFKRWVGVNPTFYRKSELAFEILP